MSGNKPGVSGRHHEGQRLDWMRLACAVTVPEPLFDVVARLDGPDGLPNRFDLATQEARVAASFGVLTIAGTGHQQTVTRTAYGDAWSAGRDAAGRRTDGSRTWPRPGRGRFDILFHPLTQRPSFPVFALTGPVVTAIRQGGWNLERGFGESPPNPVSEVEMRGTLIDGTEVSVQSASGRSALPAVRLSDPEAYLPVQEQLMAAMIHCSAPWQIRSVDVDGAVTDLLILDLSSAALPTAVIDRAGLLAVAQLGDTAVSVVSDNPDVQLALTTIPADDIIGSAIS